MRSQICTVRLNTLEKFVIPPGSLALLKAYGPITKNSILLNANYSDLKDLVRNIVKEIQQISCIYWNMELAASRMLHRAQKYEIAPSLIEDPNIVSSPVK